MVGCRSLQNEQDDLLLLVVLEKKGKGKMKKGLQKEKKRKVENLK